MKYILFKKDTSLDVLYKKVQVDIGNNGKFSGFIDYKEIDTLEECTVISGAAKEYFNDICICIEVDDKTATVILLKYSEYIQKSFDKNDSVEIIQKLREFLKLTHNLKEFLDLFNKLQLVEKSLATNYKLITNEVSDINHLNEISDLYYRDYYSLENNSLLNEIKKILD